jgi:hypothetical protein
VSRAASGWSPECDKTGPICRWDPEGGGRIGRAVLHSLPPPTPPRHQLAAAAGLLETMFDSSAGESGGEMQDFVISEHTLYTLYKQLKSGDDTIAREKLLAVAAMTFLLPLWVVVLFGNSSPLRSIVWIAVIAGAGLWGCRRALRSLPLEEWEFKGFAAWPQGGLALFAGIAAWDLVGMFAIGFSFSLWRCFLAILVMVGGEVAARAIMWKLNFIPPWVREGAEGLHQPLSDGAGGVSASPYLPPAGMPPPGSQSSF